MAALTGETLTGAVRAALTERLERERLKSGRPDADLAARLRAAGRRLSALPMLDPRSPDEILGYDETGLPS